MTDDPPAKPRGSERKRRKSSSKVVPREPQALEGELAEDIFDDKAWASLWEAVDKSLQREHLRIVSDATAAAEHSRFVLSQRFEELELQIAEGRLGPAEEAKLWERLLGFSLPAQLRALVLLRRSDLSTTRGEQIEYLTQATDADPECIGAHVLLGAALTAIARFEEVILHADIALQLISRIDPDATDNSSLYGPVEEHFYRNMEGLARLSRGIALSKQGKLSEGVAELSRAEKIDPAYTTQEPIYSPYDTYETENSPVEPLRHTLRGPFFLSAAFFRSRAQSASHRQNSSLITSRETIPSVPQPGQISTPDRAQLPGAAEHLNDEDDLNKRAAFHALADEALKRLTIAEFREAIEEKLAAKVKIAMREATDRAKAEPRPEWIKAHKQGVQVPEFVKEKFAAELANGTMHRGMFDQYKNLRRDFHAYQRHHKLPEWLAAIPTKAEWDKHHPPAPLPAEEVRRLERETRRAQRHQRRAHAGPS